MCIRDSREGAQVCGKRTLGSHGNSVYSVLVLKKSVNKLLKSGCFFLFQIFTMIHVTSQQQGGNVSEEGIERDRNEALRKEKRLSLIHIYPVHCRMRNQKK